MTSPFSAQFLGTTAPSNTRALTAQQRNVLKKIEEHIALNSMPPTRRELGEALQIRLNAVQDHLQALKDKGAIAIKSGMSRGIRLIEGFEQSKRKAVQSTSKAALKKLIASGKYSGRKAQVMAVIKPGRDYSLQEICILAKLPINVVSGRVCDLKESGDLVHSKQKRPCKETGEIINPVRLPEKQMALPL